VTYQLHHGDCVEWLRGLPDKSADHTITDPPYEAEAHTKQRRTLGGVSGRGAARGVTRVIQSAPLDFAAITPAEREAVSREIVRVTRGWALVFCQTEGVTLWRDALVAAGGKYRRACVWVKPNAQPQMSGDRPAQGYEMLCLAWCGAGRSRWHGGGARGVFVHPMDSGYLTGKRAGHPTEKPLPLMSELVSLFTDPGDLVLDPYAGSGTTGVACMRLGRRFAGAERDDRYHALAKERLDAEASGISLQASRAGQQSLFGGDK
jgi:DNA modification methylase